MSIDLTISNRTKTRAVATIEKIAEFAGRLGMTNTEVAIRSQGKQLSEDKHPFTVDVFHPQMRCFTCSKSTAVDQAQDRPVL